MDKHKNLIFILPALIGTFIFIIIPIFCSFALSFTEWDLLNEIKFVGLDNYKSILSEPEFLQILLNYFCSNHPFIDCSCIKHKNQRQ